jgi:hypothetical protein
MYVSSLHAAITDSDVASVGFPVSVLSPSGPVSRSVEGVDDHPFPIDDAAHPH